jgi:hypothetical protein
MFSFLKKKNGEVFKCFFCDEKVTKETCFHFQYSADGSLYNEKICGSCAKTLEEMIERK